MEPTKNRAEWRDEARNLGVNPDEQDDSRFWAQLDRAKAIVDSFQHHAPKPDQIDRIQSIRSSCVHVARVILRSTQIGPDQTAALRKLHEAMMTANKAIVLEAE